MGSITLPRPAICACLFRGSRAAPCRRQPRTAEYRRHHQSAYRQVSGRLLPQTLTVPSPAFILWTVLCGSPLIMLSRPTEKMTATGLMRGAYDHPARRAGGKRCSPTYLEREPEPEHFQPPTHRPFWPSPAV